MFPEARAGGARVEAEVLRARHGSFSVIASRMVPREKLMETAKEMAEKMVSKNPLGLVMTKEAINMNLNAASLEQALHLGDLQVLPGAHQHVRRAHAPGRRGRDAAPPGEGRAWPP